MDAEGLSLSSWQEPVTPTFPPWWMMFAAVIADLP